MTANLSNFCLRQIIRRGSLHGALKLLVAIFCLAMGWLSAPALAQTGKNFVAPTTDAQGRRTVLRGAEYKRVDKETIEITGMHAETFRGEQKDLIVQAPECVFNSSSKVASSRGPLSIRTADTRLSIEGEGFGWELGDFGLSSKLTISNQVHSLVRKGLIRTGPRGAEDVLRSGSGKSVPSGLVSESASLEDDIIEIKSEQFEYQSDLAVYRGTVRVRESDGDLSCGILTVHFNKENGGMEKLEAEKEVVLNQAGTRAMADRAIYVVGQENETVEFIGRALWSDGLRQGSAERMSFDRQTRQLTAEGRAYLRLPRAALGQAGLASVQPARVMAPPSGELDFVDVFSDRMTIKLPQEPGPIESITADGNVLIADPQEDGRALADKAVYSSATGLLELSGSPIFESARRLVNGRTLRFDQGTRVFRAGPDAYVRMPIAALGRSGLFAGATGLPAEALASTNQFIEVWSSDFEYHTNRLVFRENVRALFLEDETPRGKLVCGLLSIYFGDHLERIEADGDVEFEQYAASEDTRAVARRVNCASLWAAFSPEGRLAEVGAQTNVRAEQEERRQDRPFPIVTTLSSESAWAGFAELTNRVERIVAENGVIFSQDQRTARGDKAVYYEQSGLMELTGQPTASMPEGRITEAELLIWDRLQERFIARGRFKSEWRRPPGGANPLLSRQPPGR
jgi:lipopolysaccharide export system protein LptA